MYIPLKKRIQALKAEKRTPKPVRMDWFEHAAQHSSGKALHLAVGLWLLVSEKKTATVALIRKTMERVNISR